MYSKCSAVIDVLNSILGFNAVKQPTYSLSHVVLGV